MQLQHMSVLLRNMAIWWMGTQNRWQPITWWCSLNLSAYWLPKLHKNPYGARFIAASHKCTTKPLSKLLTSCLKLITNHFKQYCNGILCRTGVNCFWIIDNSEQVLLTLNKINYFSTARHLDSYDFSTLYTSIPHESLKNALIKEAYKVRDSAFLIADKTGRAYWSSVPSKSSSKQSITEEVLVTYVEYLILMSI